MNDKCISFNLDNNVFRGRIIRLERVMSDIFSHLHYPENVAMAVSEMSALAAMLASLMKYEGLFTLQIYGDGPISTLISDVTSEGKIRACARYDEKKMKKAQHQEHFIRNLVLYRMS